MFSKQPWMLHQGVTSTWHTVEFMYYSSSDCTQIGAGRYNMAVIGSAIP